MINQVLEFISTTFAEFALIYQDYKHRKRIRKREKEDGIKRPVQKYLFQPSAIAVMVVLGIGCISAVIFFTYQRMTFFPEKTKKEISEISERMEKWKVHYGAYPGQLNELIGNSPLQQDWSKDAWDRDYTYTVTGNGNGFLIVSAGSDGKFGTKDDIKSE